MNKFQQLLDRDSTRDSDLERKALFFILANNDDLFSKADKIYDFEDRCINLDCFTETDLSGGLHSLVKIGFNLFNGFPADILDTFSNLDQDNMAIALQAIKMRFYKPMSSIEDRLALAREKHDERSAAGRSEGENEL